MVAKADDFGEDGSFIAGRLNAANISEREIRAFGFDDESGDAEHAPDAAHRAIRTQTRLKVREHRGADGRWRRGGHT